MDNRHFSNFHIAGFTYYNGVDVFAELKIGTELNLKAEPNNRHDENAVAIYYHDTKLGYIPKTLNEAISKLVRCGYADVFEVKINQVNPETYPEKQVSVLVRVREREGQVPDEQGDLG